jgi:crotonobetainyl-CoA:carnitine CoA-transferase CaiB-like acyl-CoA transferase
MHPLEDIRVLAVEQFGAGPWGTMQLADLGADVIKVEDPTVDGDLARYVPPFQEADSSLYFEGFNRNKRSITLDLRHEQARPVLEDLVRSVDAVFSNLRGDQPARLGLRYEDLREANPRIVCVSLSGFGSTGPRATQGAYDATIQALAGWMSITGGPDAPPTRAGLSLVDFSSGYVAAIAILAGVHRARRDGVGGDADLSLHETALSLLSYMAVWNATRGWLPQRMADSAHQTIVPFQAFAASDGWLMVACPKETLWRRLCEALDRPALADDERFASLAARSANRDVLVPILEEAFAVRTVAEWSALLDERGIPCGAVNDVEAALADPQVASRGSVVAYEQALLGEVRTVATPLRLPPQPQARRGPHLGEHTADVLSELCGYSRERIDELRASGVFGRA